MYSRGDGVSKDDEIEFSWYKAEVESGHHLAPISLISLIECYIYGRGTEKDTSESFCLCLAHSESGNDHAQSRLGRMYMDGVGVPRDYVFAYAWLNIAAAGGDEPASEWRDKLELKMTKTQVSDAQRLASRWEVGKSIAR